MGQFAGFPGSEGDGDGGGGFALGLDGSLSNDLAGAVLDLQPDFVLVGFNFEDAALGAVAISGAFVVGKVGGLGPGQISQQNAGVVEVQEVVGGGTGSVASTVLACKEANLADVEGILQVEEAGAGYVAVEAFSWFYVGHFESPFVSGQVHKDTSRQAGDTGAHQVKRQCHQGYR